MDPVGGVKVFHFLRRSSHRCFEKLPIGARDTKLAIDKGQHTSVIVGTVSTPTSTHPFNFEGKLTLVDWSRIAYRVLFDQDFIDCGMLGCRPKLKGLFWRILDGTPLSVPRNPIRLSVNQLLRDELTVDEPRHKPSA